MTGSLLIVNAPRQVVIAGCIAWRPAIGVTFWAERPYRLM